jgi:hypothetical protein
VTRIDEALRRAHSPAPAEPLLRARPAVTQAATVLEFHDYLPEAVGLPEEPAMAMKRGGTELEAMQAIAEVLGDLPDAETRARVLKWANELYGDGTYVAPTPALPEPLPGNVAGVHVDVEVDPQPLGATLDDPLAVEDLEELFSCPPPARPDRETPRPPAPAAIEVQPPTPPAKPEAVATMLQSFIEDFRKLAAEWEREES